MAAAGAARTTRRASGPAAGSAPRGRDGARRPRPRPGRRGSGAEGPACGRRSGRRRAGRRWQRRLALLHQPALHAVRDVRQLDAAVADRAAAVHLQVRSLGTHLLRDRDRVAQQQTLVARLVANDLDGRVGRLQEGRREQTGSVRSRATAYERALRCGCAIGGRAQRAERRAPRGLVGCQRRCTQRAAAGAPCKSRSGSPARTTSKGPSLPR